MRKRWLNYNHWVRLIPISITTVGLYGSVAVESFRLSQEDNEFEVASPYYIIFVLRVVTLVSAVKLFSPLKISSNALQSLITKFRLKHLANVSVFYFAALYIFALIGVHEIGPLDYHCISDSIMTNTTTPLQLCWVNATNDECDICDNFNNSNSSNDCVSLDSLSVPDLHCHPRKENDTDYNVCPKGYSCRKVNIGRNFGYYGHYDHLGMLCIVHNPQCVTMAILSM